MCWHTFRAEVHCGDRGNLHASFGLRLKKAAFLPDYLTLILHTLVFRFSCPCVFLQFYILSLPPALLTYCSALILSSCNHVQLSFCFVLLSYSLPILLSSYLSILILPSCLLIFLYPCPHFLLSTCPLVFVPSCTPLRLSCCPPSLSFCPPTHVQFVSDAQYITCLVSLYHYQT